MRLSGGFAVSNRPCESLGAIPGSIRPAARSKARSRTRPSSGCSRPRWRCRRNGASLRPGLEAPATGDRGIQEGRQGARPGARRRRREGAVFLWHQAARGRSVAAEAAGDLKRGVVTCEVTEVKEGGIDVKIVGTDLTTFIRRGDSRATAASSGPAVCHRQKVDARVTQFDRRTRKVQVSIKALEVAEEKEAIAQYGSSIPARRSAISSEPRSSGRERRPTRRKKKIEQ